MCFHSLFIRSETKMKKQNILTALSLLALALSSGCEIVTSITPETGHYYINPESNFAAIGRVVVLEPVNNTDYPDLAEDLGRTTCRELQKKHLFNARILKNDSAEWKDLQLDDSSYSLEEMSAIRAKLRADAVIVGTVTEYRPYPHLLVGMNLRMIDLKAGQLVWGFEQLWDTTDRKLESRMKAYFEKQMRHGYEPMDWQLLLASPRAFNKFVAYEVAQTFPDPM